MNSYEEYTTQPIFNECIAFYRGLNNTNGIGIHKPSSVEWTMTYIPESVVHVIYYAYMSVTFAVYFNVTDALCYIRIHQNISR